PRFAAPFEFGVRHAQIEKPHLRTVRAQEISMDAFQCRAAEHGGCVFARACASIQCAIAASHAALSWSSDGMPSRIFSILRGGWKSSP
ncbi:MAG: hypothetical protein C4338_04545, partial [Rhodanobacteraceae bacterium]